MSSLHDAFELSDGDADGWLSLPELRRSFERLDLGLAPRQVEELFGAFDVDGDGRLRFGELVRVFEEAVPELVGVRRAGFARRCDHHTMLRLRRRSVWYLSFAA